MARALQQGADMPFSPILPSLLVFLLAAPSLAAAAEPTLLSADLGLSAVAAVRDDGGETSGAADLSLGAARRFGWLTVGADVGGHASRFGAWSIGVAAGPAIGALVPLGGGARLWPQVHLSVGYGWSEQVTGTAPLGTVGVSAGAFVPVLVDLAGGFFVGLGPYVSRDLWTDRDDDQATTHFGVRSTVGGAF